MPRRTNEFQQIVFIIQRQLAGKAVVTESMMLKDVFTGRDVEVDVVVVARVAGCEIVIGVECTAEARPATVEWVREMLGKHDSLPIDKTILVSRSGFTPDALMLANARNIAALTLETAEQSDWSDLIRDLNDLTLSKFDFSILNGEVQVVCNQVDSDISPFEVRQDSLVSVSDWKEPVPFNTYANTIIGDPDIGRTVMNKWWQLPPESRRNEFDFTLSFKPGVVTNIQHQDGFLCEVEALNLVVHASVQAAPLQLEPRKYMGKNVAYGVTENLFGDLATRRKDLLVTIVKDEPGSVSGAILVPDQSESDRRVVPMRFTPDDDPVSRQTNAKS